MDAIIEYYATLIEDELKRMEEYRNRYAAVYENRGLCESERGCGCADADGRCAGS